MSAMNPRSNNPTDSLEQAVKSIQTIKRHRKQRQAKFREMAREEEEGSNVRDRWLSRGQGEEVVCPVCSQTVRGDQDVLDAHVDACLANESQRLEEERIRQQELQRASEEDIVWDEDVEGGGHVGDVRGSCLARSFHGHCLQWVSTGTGFHTRDRHEQDVDDEVDIDGEDQAFGDAQFTEGDILPVDHPQPAVDQDVEVEIEGDSEDEAQREQKTLRDLVAEGKVVRKAVSDDGINAVKEKMDEVMGVGDADKMDLAILAARKRGDKSSLITALKNKVKQLVRIISHCERSTIYRLFSRNPCVYHRPLHYYAEYASTHMTNQLCRQGVGILVVGNAGSVALALQNSVPSASV